jgi:hypothetical protein
MRERPILDPAGELERLTTFRPAESWHEDDGNALWWLVPISEAPYSGTPLDIDFPYGDPEDGHWPEEVRWTPLPMPKEIPSHG